MKRRDPGPAFDTARFRRTALALHRVCAWLEARDVPYSLAFGTLLGAVRHGGFIPHDEDVDLYLARRHSPLVRVMAKHFGVETRYNTPPHTEHSALQKLCFPGAFDIDFFNEGHADVRRDWQVHEAFFTPERCALGRLRFCNRGFWCIEDVPAYLDAVYGPDCLRWVDLRYRGDQRYTGIPRDEKVPLHEYRRRYRGFLQPDIAAELKAERERRLGGG